MPVQTRATDTYTKGNLLLGFSQVTFTPALAAGGYGTAVPLGILSGEELQKSVELLQLERGDAGLIVIDRELVSKLELSMQLTTFDFRADLAQYIFASASVTAVTANSAQAVLDDPVTIPSVSPFDTFLSLSRSDVAEASFTVTFAPIVEEAVGTGNGVLGGTQGDFSLDQKIKSVVFATENLTVTVTTTGGSVKTYRSTGGTNTLVAGSTPGATELAIEIGEEDSIVTGSGALRFGSSETPPSGARITATYTPSFTGADIALTTDYRIDPVAGRIRFLHAAADASPFRLTANAPGTNLLVDYTYNKKASNTLLPFSQTVFSGKAQIKHLTDVGINFIWDIPSCSLRITDDALTFDAADFSSAVLQLNILNAGGSAPYGTLALSSEAESA